MEKVSVIIPTYNNEDTIIEAVESVLNQSYKNIEIIVIDDGSTDSTGDLIKKYLDKITYIKQQNQERSSARNRGILEATGKYIAFLDADDLYLKHKIEHQLNLLEKNQDFGMLYSNTYYLTKRELIETHYKEISGKVYPKILKYLKYFHTPNLMVRKDILDKVGHFNTELSVHEDWDLWIRISKEAKILFDQIPLSIIRRDHQKMNKKKICINRLKFLKLLPKITEKRYYVNFFLSGYYYSLSMIVNFNLRGKYLKLAFLNSLLSLNLKILIRSFICLIIERISARVFAKLISIREA